MDSVRFGRALGIGARSAAKALAGAVDAATASNPSPVRPRQAAPPASPGPSATSPSASGSTVPNASPRSGQTPHLAPRTASSGPVANAARTAARATFQARKTGKGVARGGKRFGEAVWGPLVKVSGVLWLEITGAFFGLFALFAGQAAWTHRADLYSAAADRDDRLRAFVFLAMALGFGYFCVSSFVRAGRRERRG